MIQKDSKRKTDDAEEEASTSASLRSEKPRFNYKSDCLFCGLPAKEDKRKGVHVFPVRTLDAQESLMKMCLQRGPSDKWRCHSCSYCCCSSFSSSSFAIILPSISPLMI